MTLDDPFMHDHPDEVSPETAQTAALIEALLFALGGPMTKQELAAHCGVSQEVLGSALVYLHEHKLGRGVIVVESGERVELRAAPEAAEVIERSRQEAYDRDIGKAGLEVLAAILYRGPQTRASIDFIRGVNSSQTLRTLAMRGLVRKISNPRDERQFIYEPTTELLAHLGVARIEDLPDYQEVRSRMESLTAQEDHE